MKKKKNKFNLKKIKDNIINRFFVDQDEEEYKLKPVKKSKVKFTSFELVFISGSFCFLGLIIGCILTSNSNIIFGTQINDSVNEFLRTYDYVKKNYYEDVDEDALAKAAISGMLDSLDDDFSYYMDDTSTENFNTETDGTYIGLGIQIVSMDNVTTVSTVFENSPAAKDGILVGDIITSVYDEDVTDKDSSYISGLISGDVGKKVNLKVRRNEEEINIETSLGKIDIPSVHSDIKEVEDKKIGYLYVDNFASNTYSQFKDKLEKIESENINSLIIDVRGNTGGHLSQVNDMLDLFFDKKTVLFQLQTKKKNKKYYAQTDEKREYPVVILTNGGSASASELLTACFKENYKDVVIVGTKTYGKGTVQEAVNLSKGTSYKFTIQKWLTPKGNWIHKTGIEPDIEVVIDENTESDIQLEKALEILKDK